MRNDPLSVQSKPMTFEQLLFLFQNKHGMIDDTCFYFADEPERSEHYIGCKPEYENPYWVGYCDIENGCDFRTAEEMFYAKIFDGKSLKDRWENVVLREIGGLYIEDWMEIFRKDINN